MFMALPQPNIGTSSPTENVFLTADLPKIFSALRRTKLSASVMSV